MNKINQGTITITSNKLITDKIFELTFDRGDLNPEVGQFIMIDCIPQRVRHNAYVNQSNLGPLLHRPFSYYLSSNDGDLSILYKVKEWGKGTGYLTNLRPDDKIHYRGSLGTPIDIEKICPKDEIVHLIAGGVGIAPITFLAQKISQLGRKVLIYFGVQELDKFFEFCYMNLLSLGIDSKEIMFSLENALLEIPSKNHYTVVNENGCTYMGSSFVIGNMIVALRNSWGNLINSVKGPIFVCAPEIVSKEVHRLSQRINRECYIFMEERMACGCGVCCSCNIGGKLVCKDGPCLNSKDVY